MTYITQAPTIVPGVDLPLALPLTTQTDPTQPAVPASGLDGVEFYLSDTFGGLPIDTSLSFPATESSATPGTYLATFPGNATLSFLTARLGRTIYVVPQYGSTLFGSTAIYVAQAQG